MSNSEANRREEKRLSCDPGDVRLEFQGRPESVQAHIVEVSRSGLQLRLRTSVQAGEPVSITRADTVISGEIRYCRPNDGGFFEVGVAILDFRRLQ
ncbi:MAG TPA: PilZ domain-containing protein [Bryobacteraceae bacterium]|nr:PilZ domain-containing protein [Bryobacteraceae bacterium]